MRKIKEHLREKVREWSLSFFRGSKLQYLEQTLVQSQITNDYLMSVWLNTQRVHPNPLAKFGKRYFSQADEDGILLEIIRRIGLNRGVCVEVGAGNGLENNTLNLLVRGWPSVWIDGGGLAFDPMCNPRMLSFQQCFVTLDNIVHTVSQGLRELGQSVIEILSIDVDGNDGYFADALLSSGLSPSVIIIETNEIVPPPIRFAQPYLSSYVWDRTKNSGWSLQSLADLLSRYGYRCVACNLQTGVNAFFVRDEHLASFQDVPQDLEAIYVGRSAHPFKFRDRRTEVTANLVERLIKGAEVTF